MPLVFGVFTAKSEDVKPSDSWLVHPKSVALGQVYVR